MFEVPVSFFPGTKGWDVDEKAFDALKQPEDNRAKPKGMNIHTLVKTSFSMRSNSYSNESNSHTQSPERLRAPYCMFSKACCMIMKSRESWIERRGLGKRETKTLAYHVPSSARCRQWPFLHCDTSKWALVSLCYLFSQNLVYSALRRYTVNLAASGTYQAGCNAHCK